MADWKKAAKLYRQGGSPTALKTRDEKGADKLETFLSSERGKSAMELLAASKRRIVLGLRDEGNGMRQVFYLDETGLRQRLEPIDGQAFIAKREDILRSDAPPLTPLDAVRAAMDISLEGPRLLVAEDIVGWIELSLNSIAEQAPLARE